MTGQWNVRAISAFGSLQGCIEVQGFLAVYLSVGLCGLFRACVCLRAARCVSRRLCHIYAWALHMVVSRTVCPLLIYACINVMCPRCRSAGLFKRWRGDQLVPGVHGPAGGRAARGEILAACRFHVAATVII